MSVTVLSKHTATKQKPYLDRDAAPFNEWRLPDGTLWTIFYRTTSGFLLRFPDLADFTISSDGETVAAYPAKDVSDPTIEHLYLNQVLPLALSRQFKLVLHSSAVEFNHFAVAFLGESGRGKSTLAASFSTSGHRFLTDDGLQLRKAADGYEIDPSHPSIRLWDDSREALIPKTTRSTAPIAYTSKLRLLANDEVEYCEMARPLRGMYFLGEGDTNEITIKPVGGRDAMIQLVSHSFLLDIEEREMLMHHFDQLTELASSLPFFRLDFPRKYDMLPLVRDRIIQHATSLDQN